MELIESEKERDQGPLAEPEPRYTPAEVQKTEHGQAWVRLALSVLIGIILVILIVLLARWVYHKVHHKTVPLPPVSQSSQESSNSSAKSGAQRSNPPASSSQSSGQSTSNSSGSTSNPTANNQIANTGPGDVAAIFAGTALAASGLHYIISVRRFTKTDA